MDNRQKISGYVMAVIGLIMLVINSIAYLFHLSFKSSPLTVLGIVFVVIGMNIIRNHKTQKDK